MMKWSNIFSIYFFVCVRVCLQYQKTLDYLAQVVSLGVQLLESMEMIFCLK